MLTSLKKDLPLSFGTLDWWFAPFSFGGFHAPVDDDGLLYSQHYGFYTSLKKFKFFTSHFPDKKFRPSTWSEFVEGESLYWYFERRLTMEEWCEVIEEIWGNQLDHAKALIFQRVFGLLQNRNFTVLEFGHEGPKMIVPGLGESLHLVG